MNMIVINAENAIIGRVAAEVAKLLLNGEQVNIVNAEKSVISGEPRAIVDRYKNKRLQKDKANPEHSAYISRRPDLFVKRIVRGMLPFKRPRGMIAFKKLKVYSGVPEGISIPKDSKFKFKFKTKESLTSRSISIADLCRQLGYVN